MTSGDLPDAARSPAKGLPEKIENPTILTVHDHRVPSGPAFRRPVLHLAPVLAGQLGGGPVDPDDPMQRRLVGARRLGRDVDGAAAERAQAAAGLRAAARYPLVRLFAVAHRGRRGRPVCRRAPRRRRPPEVPFDHDAAPVLHLLHGLVHGHLRRTRDRRGVQWPRATAAVLVVVLAAFQRVRAAQQQRRLLRPAGRIVRAHHRRHVHAHHPHHFRLGVRLVCNGQRNVSGVWGSLLAAPRRVGQEQTDRGRYVLVSGREDGWGEKSKVIPKKIHTGLD